MSSRLAVRRLSALLVALALCVGLSGCKTKVTKANADKVTTDMSESEATAILGPPTDIFDGSGKEGGVGLAVGVDMPTGPRLPPGTKKLTWKAGDKEIELTVKDGKVTHKKVTGL